MDSKAKRLGGKDKQRGGRRRGERSRGRKLLGDGTHPRPSYIHFPTGLVEPHDFVDLLNDPQIPTFPCCNWFHPTLSQQISLVFIL